MRPNLLLESLEHNFQCVTIRLAPQVRRKGMSGGITSRTIHGHPVPRLRLQKRVTVSIAVPLLVFRRFQNIAYAKRLIYARERTDFHGLDQAVFDGETVVTVFVTTSALVSRAPIWQSHRIHRRSVWSPEDCKMPRRHRLTNSRLFRRMQPQPPQPQLSRLPKIATTSQKRRVISSSSLDIPNACPTASR